MSAPKAREGLATLQKEVRAAWAAVADRREREEEAARLRRLVEMRTLTRAMWVLDEFVELHHRGLAAAEHSP